MKSHLIAVMLAATALSGCGQSPEKIVKRLEKKLGVDIELNAERGDTCFEEQLFALYAQYKALPKDVRATYEAKIRSAYKRIVLNGTVVTETIRGDVTRLSYYRRECGSNSCWNDVIATKSIQADLKIEGKPAVTELVKGDELVITPAMSVDRSLRRVYLTRYVELYDRIETTEDQEFIEAREQGQVFLDAEYAQPRGTCGARVQIQHLLKQE